MLRKKLMLAAMRSMILISALIYWGWIILFELKEMCGQCHPQHAHLKTGEDKSHKVSSRCKV
jgi:hypothetical protein